MSFIIKGGRIRRKDPITFDKAKQRFIEYYDKNPTEEGQLRGKMFDMMYQKKPKYSFKCNNSDEPVQVKSQKGEIITLEPGWCEPGSAKYLLESGPKTFDIEGIDSFEEAPFQRSDEVDI